MSENAKTYVLKSPNGYYIKSMCYLTTELRAVLNVCYTKYKDQAHRYETLELAQRAADVHSVLADSEIN